MKTSSCGSTLKVVYVDRTIILIQQNSRITYQEEKSEDGTGLSDQYRADGDNVVMRH